MTEQPETTYGGIYLKVFDEWTTPTRATLISAGFVLYFAWKYVLPHSIGLVDGYRLLALFVAGVYAGVGFGRWREGKR